MGKFFKRYRPFSGTKKVKAVNQETDSRGVSNSVKAKNGESSRINDLSAHEDNTNSKKIVDCGENSQSASRNVSKRPNDSHEDVEDEGKVPEEASVETINPINNSKKKAVSERKAAEEEKNKTINTIKKDTHVVVPKNNSNKAPKINFDETVEMKATSDLESGPEAQRAAKINDLLSDWDEVADSDSLVNNMKEKNSNACAGDAAVEPQAGGDNRSRLSYSGRRVRAQR